MVEMREHLAFEDRLSGVHYMTDARVNRRRSHCLCILVDLARILPDLKCQIDK